MADELREWIDKATYHQLLERWRCAPVGDPIFQGEIGEYYAEVMKTRRAQVGNAEHVRISKQIGF